MPFRLDNSQLRPMRTLPDGRIVVDGAITRTGVFKYYERKDGRVVEVLEYRSPEEVFHKDSLASFAFVPLTDDHPSELVTADNAKSITVGQTGENIRVDGSFVIAPIVINDIKTIAKAKQGKVELSCGYECEIDNTPGVSPQGERFDRQQTNIRGNHLALVDVGRAGPDARIRMDGAYQIPTSTQPSASGTDRNALMDPELLKKLTDATLEAASQKTRADAAEAKVSEVDVVIAKLEAERDAAVARADKAEADSKAALEGMADKVKARIELEKTASTFIKEDCDFNGKSDLEIKKAVVEAAGRKIPEARKDSDAYIDAAFDLAVETKTDKDDQAELKVRKAISQKKDSGNDLTAQEKNAEYQKNRWKGNK